MNRRIKALCAVLLLFLGWTIFAPFLGESLIVEKTLEKADAVLILGGSSVYLERTQKGAEIYKNGAAAKIFLSDDGERGGWSKIERRNPPFAELARQNLILHGVPAENIEILQPTVSGTIDEARVLAEKAKAENLRSLLIVTSAYHTRRALWTFEKVFAENGVETDLGIAAPPAGIETPRKYFWWFSPRGWNLVAGEYVKFLAYWTFY